MSDKAQAIVDAIFDELGRAQRLHPVWPCDTIHQAAILSEEAGEVVKAANNYVYHGGDMQQIRNELVQVGAMVVRMLANLPKV